MLYPPISAKSLRAVNPLIHCNVVRYANLDSPRKGTVCLLFGNKSQWKVSIQEKDSKTGHYDKAMSLWLPLFYKNLL